MFSCVKINHSHCHCHYSLGKLEDDNLPWIMFVDRRDCRKFTSNEFTCKKKIVNIIDECTTITYSTHVILITFGLLRLIIFLYIIHTYNSFSMISNPIPINNIDAEVRVAFRVLRSGDFHLYI